MHFVTLAFVSFCLNIAAPMLGGSSQEPMRVSTLPPSAQRAHIKKVAEYNTWANEQLVDWLRTADSTQWDMSIESSFNTLNLTVRHLWNAEYGWLTTLQNTPWNQAVEYEQELSQAQVLDGFVNTSRAFRDFVQNMSDVDFDATRAMSKSETPVTLTDIIHHVCNHSTHHRGQLITMGRQAGLDSPPRTDYIYYVTLN